MSSEEAYQPIYQLRFHDLSHGAAADHTDDLPRVEATLDAAIKPDREDVMGATDRSGSDPSLPSCAPSHASGASCVDSDEQCAFHVYGGDCHRAFVSRSAA